MRKDIRSWNQPSLGSTMSAAHPEIKIETAKFDARFPNVNQTRNCWVNFRDYHRCIKAKGQDYQPCEWFKRNYRSLCPVAWVEQWEEQVENGTFAGEI